MAELIKNRESLAEVRAKLNAANTAFSSRAAFEAATIPTGVDLIYVIDTPSGGGPTQSSVFQLIRSELGDWVAGDGSVWRLSFGSDALQDVIEAAQAAEQAAQDALTQAEAAADAALAAQAAEQAAQDAENSLLEWKGAWAASTDYEPSDIVHAGGSAFVCVMAHTSGTGEDWNTVWSLFAAQGAVGSGAGDMLKSENLFGLTNVSVARSNLGLEALATLPVSGTMDASTVLYGDGVFRGALSSQVTLYDTVGVHEWAKPVGYPSTARVAIEGVGGGGGGGRANVSGGGGGGEFFRAEFTLGDLPGTLDCAVGAGGPGGPANSTPGTAGSASIVTGVVGGDTVEFFRASGGGGGPANAYAGGTGGGGVGDGFWGGGKGAQPYKPQSSSPNGNTIYPAVLGVPAGASAFGGGGGGTTTTDERAGGASRLGGKGGTYPSDVNGSAPGGGGAGVPGNTAAGNGARGMIRITVSP